MEGNNVFHPGKMEEGKEYTFKERASTLQGNLREQFPIRRENANGGGEKSWKRGDCLIK